MMASKNAVMWGAWFFTSVILLLWLGYTLLANDTNKSVFMPGPLSAGHHQLLDRCDVCHTDSFGGGEVLQTACVECHGEDRTKPFDSHPAKKFKDPRNAELLEQINALECTSCHSEHKPEMTAKDGLTQPRDICFHCHQDIAKERPSHQGMGFDTCKDSGCHNFHNNRALYTDFLLKHLDEPTMLSQMQLPQKQFANVLDEIAEYPRDAYPVKQLGEQDIDAKDRLGVNEAIKGDWLATAHARSGVNCTACHVELVESEPANWNDHPEHSVCTSCHNMEFDRFIKGKHGMRLKHQLTPMTTEMARLPMKHDAHGELTCISCHGAHRFDVNAAAVESCLGCHDDRHSLAYKQSPHYVSWQKERSGDAQPGTGVSCASCHMPRVEMDINDWSSRIVVDHNQSANLSPNSKMIRSACLHCHGMSFTLDALADEHLIKNNFIGQPSVHVNTMDLAADEDQRRKKKAAEQGDDSGMFGF